MGKRKPNCFEGHSTINMQYRMPASANELTIVYLLRMLTFAVCGEGTAFYIIILGVE